MNEKKTTGNHREIAAVLLVIRRPNTIIGELYREKLGCIWKKQASFYLPKAVKKFWNFLLGPTRRFRFRFH